MPGYLDPQGTGGGPNPPPVPPSLYERLQEQPTIVIPVPATAVSGKLISTPCILIGYSFRETTAAAGATVELRDGGDATGGIVAEETLLNSAAAVNLNTDTDVAASATGAAAALAPALPGVAGQTTFVSGFEVSGSGATAASVIVVTLTGVVGGPLSFELAIPAGVAAPVSPLVVEFARPIPAAAVNTAITLNVPSFGAGNTNAGAVIHGFQRLVGAQNGALGSSILRSLGRDGPLCQVGVFLRVVLGSVAGAVYLKR